MDEKIVQPVEYKPFRINPRNPKTGKKDLTIFAVRDDVLCIFFRNDWGWLNVPDHSYNRRWREIQKNGITYIPKRDLIEIAATLSNGDALLRGICE